MQYPDGRLFNPPITRSAYAEFQRTQAIADPRPISGPEIERHSGNVAFAASVVIVAWLASAALGFILGRML